LTNTQFISIKVPNALWRIQMRYNKVHARHIGPVQIAILELILNSNKSGISAHALSIELEKKLRRNVSSAQTVGAMHRLKDAGYVQIVPAQPQKKTSSWASPHTL
jgi:hypothetical protein